MKFLIAAIAASLVFPAAVSAETWWLIIAGSGYQAVAIEKVATTSEEECEAAGKKLYDSRELKAPYDIHSRGVIGSIRYSCVKGK